MTIALGANNRIHSLPVSVSAKLDPTRTTLLRRQYVKEVWRRFGMLKRIINESVRDNDALRLSNELSVFQQRRQAATKYDFPSDIAGREQAFMDWLGEMIDNEILDATKGVPRRVLGQRWQDVYVRAAYGRGVESANAALRRIRIEVPEQSLGVIFNQPIHANLLAMLYGRNFTELRGITEAMAVQIRRTLAEGMGRGIGPHEMARLINERVDKVGIYRATVMARTEIIRAHAEATLARYVEFGIEGVTAKVEFSSSGDKRVCEKCKNMDGRIYSINDAYGMIPVHPQCRCAWLPVWDNRSKKS